jgi:hypothetical protein
MASTYVNDLRLNEMATGDASGSWGTVTNTNLELIGEAFSYGTETIGDADSTLTIADGASDPVRSFFLKITSSVDLTTTRIVTIAPNTVSKVWMIENATTGSQVITIKQGSGATINVPNGQVKMISTDGAGSGGAVLDLLVDVDLTGTTTLVNLDVSGAVDIAGDLTLSAGGDGALRFTAASSVKVLDNNAAALVFEEADNAYMTFVTTDGSEAVKFDKALDINAATQIDATVTVGVDDTGYDVKFFGATAGAYMLWDESADDLILGGAAGLSVNSTALVTGVLTTTAATVHTGGITMPDNAKAIFGAGSDLQIYHASGESYVEDVGAGDLSLRTNGNRVMIATTVGETMGRFEANSYVKLYYDNAEKLATTATGVTVTGTAVTDGLTVAGNLSVDGGTIKLDGNYPVGTGNVALGDTALDSVVTDGDYNTAVGAAALTADTKGQRTVAIGASALESQNFTSATISYNTAVGFAAGSAVTTGVQNTLIGGLAGDALTDADENVAVGYGALSADTLGSRNVALGFNTLAVQNFTTATNAYNIAIGHNAGVSVTTGVENVLIGGLAGQSLTDADYNVAIGVTALFTDTLGSKNTAIGQETLRTQNFTTATDSFNTAVGFHAGRNVTTGVNNTLIGALAGDALTDADNNVAVGRGSLGADTLGSRTTAIGFGALSSQNFTSATDTYNTAVGFNAGVTVSTGIQNTLIGSSAGDSLTDADYNTAIGAFALQADTLGSRSVAIGREALYSQNFTSATDAYNVAIGYQAGTNISTGINNTLIGGNAGTLFTDADNNVAIGFEALKTATTAIQNTAIGTFALYSATLLAADSNVACGFKAGYTLTTGDNNTFLGNHAGYWNGVDVDGITTGTNNTYLGSKSYPSSPTVSNEITLGNANISSLRCADQTIAALSDGRDKTDVVDLPYGLDFINKTRPVQFKWDKRTVYEDDQKQGKTHNGFIAQELLALGNNEQHRLVLDENPELLEARYSNLLPMMVKAIQELSAKNDALEVRLAALEG